MKNYSAKFKRCLVVLSFFLFNIAITGSVLAEENIISSVMISKSKEKANGYELNIDSTETVQYKANIEDDGSIYFDLKNSVLASDIGTIYDDVSNIENVVVKQLDRNKVRIYIKGENARNTELVFINSLFEPAQKSTKKLIINRPINQYLPVNKEDLDFQEEIQDWDDNSFNFAHLGATVLKALKEGPMGMVLVLMLIVMFGSIIIKSLASKLSQEREPLIGLNNKKYVDNSITLGTQVINPTAKVQKRQINQPKVELESLSHRNQTLKNAQIELTKAHQKYQEYLKNKYKDNYKAKLNSINVDAVKKGIALNQYQKSTQNPYTDQEVIKLKRDFTQTSRVRLQDEFRIPPRPRLQPKTEFTSPYIQKPAPRTIQNAPKQNNMKFLESVTKIYEESGRGDLASGLKNSISKAKQTI